MHCRAGVFLRTNEQDRSSITAHRGPADPAGAKMQLRPATPQDTRQVAELIERAVIAHKSQDFNDEGWLRFRDSNSAAGISTKLAEDGRITLVAEAHGQIIGIISVVNGTKIDLLFVCPQHRRKGIATTLWRTMRESASARRTATTYWVRSSTAGVPFYQRLGFTHDGGRQSHCGISFFLMRLQVDANSDPSRACD